MRITVTNVYDKKEDCCGCYACSSLCSNGAISMIEDAEGFFYPVVNQEKCIGCNACRIVCPIIAKGI